MSVPDPGKAGICRAFWTLMFFVKSQTAVDVRGILPGVMSMSILFGTTSMLAVTITFEKRSRSFERLLLVPVPQDEPAILRLRILLHRLHCWPYLAFEKDNAPCSSKIPCHTLFLGREAHCNLVG